MLRRSLSRTRIFLRVVRRAPFCLRTSCPLYGRERLADFKGRLGENPKLCFEKYVDVSTSCDAEMCITNWDNTQAMIDLLIPGQTPGIKEKLVDLYGKPELLFFGPDGMFPPIIAMLHAP